MRVLPVVIVSFAVVVCAWFVLDARQAHELDQATAILSQSGSRTPSELRTVSSLLGSAQSLNPDRSVDVLRARVLIDEQRLGAARRILEGVVQSEPLNIEGWIWLGGASFGNKAELQKTGAQIAFLDPIDARAGG